MRRCLVVVGMGMSLAFGQEPARKPDAAGGESTVSPQLPQRNAADLPRAEPGRWSDWKPGPAPAETVAEPYLAAVRSFQEGWVARASDGAFLVLHTEPDYPPALLLGAAACFRMQRYGDAVELYQRLLDHAPGELARTRQLGHSLHSLGRSAEALAHYERMLAAKPGDLAVRRARGVVRLRTGDVAGGLKDLEAVLVLQPGDAESLYWRASALFDDEREGSLDAARAARDAAPFAARTWYLLSQAAGEEGEEELAQRARVRHGELAAAEASKRVLEQRLMIDPTDLAAAEDLARLLLTVGDFRRARAAYGSLAAAADKAGNAEVAARARRGLEAQRNLGR